MNILISLPIPNACLYRAESAKRYRLGCVNAAGKLRQKEKEQNLPNLATIICLMVQVQRKCSEGLLLECRLCIPCDKETNTCTRTEDGRT